MTCMTTCWSTNKKLSDPLILPFPYRNLDQYVKLLRESQFSSMWGRARQQQRQRQQQPEGHKYLPSNHAPRGWYNPFIPHSDFNRYYGMLAAAIADIALIEHYSLLCGHYISLSGLQTISPVFSMFVMNLYITI